jgi:hypothetical protein
MSENQKNGICPMMSNAVINPGMGSNVIDLPHGQAASVMETGILAVPCAGPNCQLWDGYQNMCSIKSLPGVAGPIEKSLERPRGDMIYGSTMAQLTESVRNIGNTLAELTRVLTYDSRIKKE